MQSHIGTRSTVDNTDSSLRMMANIRCPNAARWLWRGLAST